MPCMAAGANHAGGTTIAVLSNCRVVVIVDDIDRRGSLGVQSVVVELPFVSRAYA